MKMLLLYHPNHGGRSLSRVRQFLLQQDVAFTLFCSTGDFHKDIAALRGASASIERVVVIGGDGTLHLAANAFAGTNITVALIPCGSGNDFARQFHVPFNTWLRSAVFGEAEPIALGRVGDRYFINIASVGLSAYVVRKTSNKSFAWAYMWQGFCALWQFVGCEVSWRSDGTDYKGKLIMLGFANGQYFGAGLRIAPPASVGPAELTQFSVNADSKWQLIRTFIACLLGVNKPPGVHFERRAKPVTILTEGIELEADGELIGQTPCQISYEAQALNFVVPRLGME